MTKEQAEIKAKAIAYSIAAELGWQEAVRILQAAAAALESEAWKGQR